MPGIGAGEEISRRPAVVAGGLSVRVISRDGRGGPGAAGLTWVAIPSGNTAVARGLAFSRAAQAIQITRRRKVKGKWSRETCYAVTSLSVTQASPAQLAAIIRRH